MTLDKTKLAAIAALPDGPLWEYLRRAGAELGLVLPTACPGPEVMARIRGMMAEPERLSLPALLRLYNQMKRRG